MATAKTKMSTLPEPAEHDSKVGYATRVLLWAMANPVAGLREVPSEVLETILSLTTGAVVGKDPGPVADCVADLRRLCTATLEIRRKLDAEADWVKQALAGKPYADGRGAKPSAPVPAPPKPQPPTLPPAMARPETIDVKELF